MDKVTVIVPNYNHSLFLEQRIESILNQTYEKFEIVILDDCSTDASKNIIEKFRTNRHVSKIIYNEVNSGNTFSQWKKGIELASNEYVWIAESDDFSDVHFLDKVIPIISTNESVGLVFCDSFIVDKESKITEIWSFASEFRINGKEASVINGKDFAYNFLINKNVIPNASAVVFRKAILINNWKYLDTRMKNSSDWKLWLNFSLEHNVGYLPENLNYFRKHANNVTTSNFILKLEALKIIKELIKKNEDPLMYSKLYRSLLKWSFNPTAWIDQVQFNHSNIRFYFRGNINYKSSKYFLNYLIKNWSRSNS